MATMINGIYRGPIQNKTFAKPPDLLNPYLAYWANTEKYGNNSGSLSTLYDISGNKRHALQTVVASQPSFEPGENASFRFDNGAAFMTLPLLNSDFNGHDWSMYFRISFSSLSGYGGIFTSGTESVRSAVYFISYGSQIYFGWHTSGWVISSKSIVVNQPYNILWTQSNSGNINLYVEESKNSTTFGGLNMGNGSANLGRSTTNAVMQNPQFKLNRMAFWKDRIITQQEFDNVLRPAA